MRKRLLKICAGFDAHQLNVVIEEGRTFKGFDRDAGSKKGRQSYVEKVSMEYSIGMENTDAGTLGGYLVLVDSKNPLDRKTVFMTNWHVLRPSDSKLPMG